MGKEEQLYEILAVDKDDFRLSGDRRLARVNEAMSWPRGSQGNMKFYEIWACKTHKVKLGKPGKEAAPNYDRCRYKDGHRGNNPNDMRPCIWTLKDLIDKNASFTNVFDELQTLSRGNERVLELLACLLFRSAFMMDHVDIGNGKWRYLPDKYVVQIINKYTPPVFGVPLEVFLHYLDALAWNEDVKYYSLGYDITKATGRQNNLLTCVNLIGVFLDRIPISKFAGAFARPPIGLSAISRKKAIEIFPLLKEIN